MTLSSSVSEGALSLPRSIQALSQASLRRFKQVTGQYALFHICFFCLAFLELMGFILFFSFLTQTTWFAFSLAGLFLTGFTYFVLTFYLQAKKPQELTDITTQFLAECSQLEDSSELRIGAIEQLVSVLHRQEYTYYMAPALESLSPVLQKFSAWLHWKDLHKMKQLLLHTLIQEHVELIKLQPTDLNVHASLAEAYAQLAVLYTDPRRVDDSHLWVSPEYSSLGFQSQRRHAWQRCLEEYKILYFYAPDEISIQKKMAETYLELDQPLEAIRCYEQILQSSPQEEAFLFQLGILYFKNDCHAQGLRLYEQLKMQNAKAAAELITYYTYHQKPSFI